MDDLTHLTHAVESLREEVAKLRERVAGLEAHAGERAVEGTRQLGDAQLAVIAAAVAAYLGVEPRIRQIRLVGDAPWAQQGRVTIQASHALSLRHG